MGPNLISEYHDMMLAMYGNGWTVTIKEEQQKDLMRAFLGGAMVALLRMPEGDLRDRMMNQCRMLAEGL